MTRLVDRQRLARQARRPRRPRRDQTMIGPGQDVAVEDSRGVAGDRLGQQSPGGSDQLAAAPRRLTDHFRGDGQFHAIELAVEGRERSDQPELAIAERRAGRGMMTADDIEHDEDEVFEGELAGVLALGGLLEELVEGCALDDPIQGDASHDGDRRVADRVVEDGREGGDQRGFGVGEVEPARWAAGRRSRRGGPTRAPGLRVEVDQLRRHQEPSVIGERKPSQPKRL
jgi:hypothetical protein